MATWMTNEQLAAAQRMTNEGHTALVIAQLMNHEFGTTLTRNAVCGLWNRGTVQRSDAQRRRAWGGGTRDNTSNRERKIREKRDRENMRKRGARAEARKVAAPMEMVATPPPTIDDLMIPAEQRRTLLQLSSSTCKWPIGDPGDADFFFCGAEPQAHSPYCAAHRHRSVNVRTIQPFRRWRRKAYVAEAAE